MINSRMIRTPVFIMVPLSKVAQPKEVETAKLGDDGYTQSQRDDAYARRRADERASERLEQQKREAREAERRAEERRAEYYRRNHS